MAEMPSGDTLRILMLEDTPTDAELVQVELRNAGIDFVAQRVATRDEFLRALEEFKPDLVLSDYKLPAYDGLSALKIVRHDHPEIPVIMVTGAVPDIDAVEFIYAGAKDYVLKDRLARLGPAVQRVLSAEKGVRARKAAETALRDSYHQLELARDEWNNAFDALRDPMFFHDPEGRITRCNRAYAERAGVPFKEIIGRRYWEVFPRGAGPLASCARETAETPEKNSEEMKLATGETFTSRSFSARDADGGYLFSVHILEDITERTQLETQLRQAVAYNRSLIEASLDPLVTISPEGKITDVNVATERATGRARGELLGTDFSDYFTEPDRARAGYRQVFEQGFVTDYPLVLRHQEGRLMDVLYNASVYRDENGNVQGVFAAARDITERKHAEEQIEENERKFRALTDTSPLAVYMSSGIEQKAEYINPTFTKLFGYTLDEVPTVAEWWPRAYPDENYRKQIVEEWQRKVEQAIRTNSAIEPMEVVVTCKDGSKKNISWGYISTGVQNWAFGLDLTERKRAEMALRRVNRALKALGAGNHALVHSKTEQELMEGICRAATDGETYRLAWVGRAMHDEGKSIQLIAAAGAGQGYVNELQVTWADTPSGSGPTGLAVRTGQTQISQDFVRDPRVAPWLDAAVKYGLASSIALPLREDGVVTGALTLYAAEPGAFDAQEVALLEEMTEDLAFGLDALRTRNERDRALEERQHYAEQLRSSLEDALQAISATVEMRDPYTAGHQRRVADLAFAIAREMGLPDEQAQGIRLAGIVHDLGKVHIPAEVLSKPGRLNEIEFDFIKLHPQAGHDILMGIAFPWPIAQAVLQHHERLDGSGYPRGLSGDAIALEARILAVADVVEAMASHRPYRPSLGLEAALSEIRAKRGSHFDPAAVEACLDLFERRGYVLLP